MSKPVEKKNLFELPSNLELNIPLVSASSNAESNATRQNSSSTNTGSSSKIKQRIVASPHRVKTQIAKISYGTNMQTAWLNFEVKQPALKRNEHQNTYSPPEVSDESKQDFSDRRFFSENYNPLRNKKDRESFEIENEILDPQLKMKDHSNTSNRCKTEIEIIRHLKFDSADQRIPNENIAKNIRCNSKNVLRTQSDDIYEAGQVGLVQRRNKHLRADDKLSNSKAFEKEQIKQRLEQLRENTQQLLKRNILKRKAKSKKIDSGTDERSTSNEKVYSHRRQVTPRICTRLNPNSLEHHKRQWTQEVEITEKSPNIEESQICDTQLSMDHLSIQTVCNSNENQASLSLNKSDIDTRHSIDNLSKQKTDSNSNGTQPPLDQHNIHNEITSKSENTNITYSYEKYEKENTTSSKTVEVNQLKLKSDGARQNLEPENIIYLKQLDRSTSTKELPFWLRPSPMPLYPYNFMVAVRRKLEAIVKPAVIESEQKSAKNEGTSTTNLQDYLDNQLYQDIKCNQLEYITPVMEVGTNNTINIQKNETECESHSTFSLQDKSPDTSKLSLQSPLIDHLNNLKSFTSSSDLQDQADADDDATTISSSVFDSTNKKSLIYEYKNSKRSLSPLSLKSVEPLKVQTKSKIMEAIKQKHIVVERGDGFKFKNDTASDYKLNDLLSDFNRSLSEALQVNKQLKKKIDLGYSTSKPNTIESDQKSISDDLVEKNSVTTTSIESTSSDSKKYMNKNFIDGTCPCLEECPNIKENNRIEFGNLTIRDIEKENKNCKIKKQENPTSVKDKEEYYTLQYNAEEKPYSATKPENQIELARNRIIANDFFEAQKCVSSADSNLCNDGIPKVQIPIQCSNTNYSDNNFFNNKEHQSLNKDNFKKSSTASADLDLQRNSNSEEDKRRKSLYGMLFSDSKEGNISLSTSGSSKTTALCEQIPKQKNSANIISGNGVQSQETQKPSQNVDDVSILQYSAPQPPSNSYINYSSVGMYEKLISTETTKSEHLTALLKMREKVLLDRTNSQIAWLEVVKQRYKTKGLHSHTTAIKKKQRGIFLKMEKEREEIKRLLQNTELLETYPHRRRLFSPTKRKREHSPDKTTATRPAILLPAPSVSSKLDRFPPKPHTQSILPGKYDIESSQQLEELLQARELELQRRRTYCERLIHWHKRLDTEEAEVERLEQQLFSYTSRQTLSPLLKKEKEGNLRTTKMEKRLQEIDKSLNELSNISGTSSTTGCDSSIDSILSIEYVSTSGEKLNKLWRRLTSQSTQKFETNRRYKLCKSDLEKIYEDAKMVVLQDFVKDEQRIAKELLGKNHLRSSIMIEDQKSKSTTASTEIEFLYKMTNVEQSDATETPDLESLDSKKFKNCPCAIDVDMSVGRNSDTPSTSVHSEQEEIIERNKLIDRNIKKFVDLTKEIVIQHTGLHRSLSDNQINKLIDTIPSSLTIEISNRNNNSSKKLRQCSNAITEFSELQIISESLQTDTKKNIFNEEQDHLERSFNCYQKSSDSLERSGDKSPPRYDIDKIYSEHSSIISPSHETPEVNHKDSNATYENLVGIVQNLQDKQLKETEIETDSSRLSKAATIDADRSTSSLNSTPLGQSYESDFDSCSSTVTQIEDVSMPIFETTLETTLEGDLNAVNVQNFKEESNSEKSHLMPDIIHNLEEGRVCKSNPCQIETTKQQCSFPSMPYMYFREIPNKPPPPYVPPAPGSPMTTIFPSEERIRDITFRRTHELFCELLKIDYVDANGEKLSSVMDEKITNIYERIIIDICREYLSDHNELLRQGDPINFYSQLAFFNPPDRLRCIQNTIYKEVRQCLGMNKKRSNRTPVFPICAHRNKRDHIGKVIIQEMYEEDNQWCSYQREENEVIDLMIEEMITFQIQFLINQIWTEYESNVPFLPEHQNATISSNGPN